MQYPTCLGVVACALVFLTSTSVPAEEVTQQRTVLRPVKERGATPRSGSEYAATDTSYQGALSLCLADWDAATHMTKLEWRRACERSVKDYPDAFRR
jgi:hypothetical protein